MDRKKYTQLVAEQLVEFKPVLIPVAIERESVLVGDNGFIDPINLIVRSQVLGRLVSTTALNNEVFPDYDYLFRAYENPVQERYTRQPTEYINFPIESDRYYDPRSGDCHVRPKLVHSVPIRFQVPVTNPVPFTDKHLIGWTKGISGAPKNTIYTKKMAHTLLPPHGLVTPFSGYPTTRTNFFPIGVLSDITEVDLKDERYVWAQNMDTVTKFWIRDCSYFNRLMYQFLNTELDEEGKPKGEITQERLKKNPDSDVLIDYLDERSKQFNIKINTKHYRPTDEVIEEFITLLENERQAYLKQVSNDKPSQIRIVEIYDALNARLIYEKTRKHPKYALTVYELIEQQKQSKSAGAHNELLISNTKGATRALYASKNNLFHRLNLAFHALNIKKKYKYDIPLLVLSDTAAPYHYHENLIKDDLYAAYRLLKAGKFPYDQTIYVVYINDSNHEAVAKKNEFGEVVRESKNLKYQENLLVDLFKLGVPDLKNINELTDETMDQNMLDEIILSIIDKMDVVGGLKRETLLMNKIFSENNTDSRDKFFLRCASLGHQMLIDHILSLSDFKCSEHLILKAISFADNNHQLDLKNNLTRLYSMEKLSTLDARLTVLNNPVNPDLRDSDLLNELAQRIKSIQEIQDQYNVLNVPFESPDILKKIKETNIEIYLNSASKNATNKKHLPEFIKLLVAYPEYNIPFLHIISANQEVRLDLLIEAHELHGVKQVSKAMFKIATEGWAMANDYLVLLEINGSESDDEFYNTNRVVSDAHLEKLYNNCANCIEHIKKQGWGSGDKLTNDYCEAMSALIVNSKDNFLALTYQLKQLEEIKKAVLSPEMLAIKNQVKRLHINAQSFFSMGNLNKANNIIRAASNVPLKDRAHIFNNEANPACNKVRKALAAHRISFSNPVKDDKVIEQWAASSFKEVAALVGRI